MSHFFRITLFPYINILIEALVDGELCFNPKSKI